MIQAADGYEYETLLDCFVGRKAQTRYNQRREDVERLKLGGPGGLATFDARYAQARQCDYGPDRASEIAWWSVIDSSPNSTPV